MKREEDLTKSTRILVGLMLLPLKITIDTFTGFVETAEKSFSTETRELASSLIDAEISTLKALNTLIERQISILEKYRSKVREERKKKERIKVE